MKKINENFFYFRKIQLINCLLAFIFFGFTVHAQSDYELKGNVVDDLGSPIPGVTVQIENTNYGAITNFDGNYSLKANLDAGSYKLVFRSLGLTTQEIILSLDSQAEVVTDVVITADILGLDAVVVTGVGALTAKKQIGNTISTVEGLDIAQSGSLDITGGLSGKLAGIQVTQNSGDPAGGISVRLRSASTVNGSSDPLYIIDGVIVNNKSTNNQLKTAVSLADKYDFMDINLLNVNSDSALNSFPIVFSEEFLKYERENLLDVSLVDDVLLKLKTISKEKLKEHQEYEFEGLNGTY